MVPVTVVTDPGGDMGGRLRVYPTGPDPLSPTDKSLLR